tara:strand:+ start:998 stop:1462 length:465 start_codon:yes stop_codon:yes gene_type:complete
MKETKNFNDHEGINKFLKKVINQRVAIAPEVLGLVFDDMADDMQTLAQQRLTQNESVLTGLLRSSITVDRGPAPTIETPPKKIIGTNVEYAPNVEYGTSPHMINSPVLIKTKDDAKGKWRYIKEHPGSRAKPYMRPAFDEVTGKLDTYFEPFFD